MRLDLKRITARTRLISLGNWPRIIPAAHAGTPTGAGFGVSRFSSPARSFRVLYAAEDFPTAFAEAVVRDRFEGRQRRFLYRPYLEGLMVTTITSTADLHLLDLTGGGTYELGIDTDAARARAHSKGQDFSRALHDQTRLDGILYDSRLTSSRCVAIYDRAFEMLIGAEPLAILQVPALADELTRLEIRVRQRRGM